MSRQNKKQTIMMAAERLFDKRRIHEVTLDEVAQVAQVGKGTIYRYFADKNELFFEAATSGFEDLCQLLDKNIPDEAGFEDRLLAACREITRFFFARRQLFRLMQMEEGRVIWDGGTLWERWLARRQLLVDALARIIEQGRGEGLVRAQATSEVLAMMLLGMLRTRARYLAGNENAEQHLELVISIFLYGAVGPNTNPKSMEVK